MVVDTFHAATNAAVAVSTQMATPSSAIHSDTLPIHTDAADNAAPARADAVPLVSADGAPLRTALQIASDPWAPNRHIAENVLADGAATCTQLALVLAFSLSHGAASRARPAPAGLLSPAGFGSVIMRRYWAARAAPYTQRVNEAVTRGYGGDTVASAGAAATGLRVLRAADAEAGRARAELGPAAARAEREALRVVEWQRRARDIDARAREARLANTKHGGHSVTSLAQATEHRLVRPRGPGAGPPRKRKCAARRTEPLHTKEIQIVGADGAPARLLVDASVPSALAFSDIPPPVAYVATGPRAQ